MKRLLSGNEAIALGAYHAGVRVATAYPGTPSSEILETLAGHEGPYVEWSTNEKVAMEIGIGAAYAGARALVSMKHVGLNVAADPFFTVSYTGVEGGLVVVSADDPGNHSSQNEQDNRHYARSAKVPMLEPSDSQEAYELTQLAFKISEDYDTPVLLRCTTRISHAMSVVEYDEKEYSAHPMVPFVRNPQKHVMIPAHATPRHIIVEKRLKDLAAFAETFSYNEMVLRDRQLGIVADGVAFQYAMEVFPNASYLKLGMSYPFPEDLMRRFGAEVEKVVVIEELDPFLENALRSFGLDVIGREFFPGTGELNPDIVADGSRRAGILNGEAKPRLERSVNVPLPKRPPALCAGCPHTGIFYILRDLGFYHSSGMTEPTFKGDVLDHVKKSGLIVSGDIGCYTLSVLPPLVSMDCQTCMGASIGGAMGFERAGISNKVVAVIGDSTFYHSGITGLVDVVYNQSTTTTIILDNNATAMTGYQGHPGTGMSARRKPSKTVDLVKVVQGVGVEDVHVVDAFDLGTLETTVRRCIELDEPSVIIVRGLCPSQSKKRGDPLTVDVDKCDGCGACLRLGCPAAVRRDDKAWIDVALCLGTACSLCQQACPQKAIVLQSEVEERI